MDDLKFIYTHTVTDSDRTSEVKTDITVPSGSIATLSMYPNSLNTSPFYAAGGFGTCTIVTPAMPDSYITVYMVIYKYDTQTQFSLDYTYWNQYSK